MKLAIINGSPRGKKSNSNRITGWMTNVMDNDTEVIKVFANETSKHEKQIEEISGCDAYLMIFPLYTDSMPGITKRFMEVMEDNREYFNEKPIYFIIHSGFPESSQSITVEGFTKNFSSLLGMKYYGGIRMGGSEALQVAPDNYFGKKKDAYEFIAGNIERLEPFDSEKTAYLSRNRKPGAIMRFIINKTGLNNMYWNNTMKKNGVYDRRFDQPYKNS